MPGGSFEENLEIHAGSNLPEVIAEAKELEEALDGDRDAALETAAAMDALKHSTGGVQAQARQARAELGDFTSAQADLAKVAKGAQDRLSAAGPLLSGPSKRDQEEALRAAKQMEQMERDIRTTGLGGSEASIGGSGALDKYASDLEKLKSDLAEAEPRIDAMNSAIDESARHSGIAATALGNWHGALSDVGSGGDIDVAIASAHELDGALEDMKASGGDAARTLDDLKAGAGDLEGSLGGSSGGGSGGGLISKLGKLFSGGESGGLLGKVAGAGGGGGISGLAIGAGVGAPVLAGLVTEAEALVSGFAAAGAGVGAFAALAIPTFDKIKTGYTSISAAQSAYNSAVTLAKVSPTKTNLSAVTADAAKLKAAYAGIPASIRPAVSSLESLKSTYSKMATAFEPDALSVFNKGLQGAKELLPDIKPFADTAAKGLSGMLGTLDKFLKTSKTVEVPGAGLHGGMFKEKEKTPFGNWLDQFHGVEKVALPAVGKGVGNVGSAIGKMLTSLPKADVARGIGDAFKAVTGVINGARAIVSGGSIDGVKIGGILSTLDNLHHAADNAGHSITNMHHAVDNVGHAFTNVGHAAGNVGHAYDNVAHASGNVGHAFDNIGHAADNVGHAVGHAFDAVGHAGGNIDHAFDNVKHAYDNASHALTPQGIGNGFKDIGKTIGGALGHINLGGALSGIGKSISGALSHINIGSALSGIGKQIGDALGHINLGSAASSVGKAVEHVISDIHINPGALISQGASLMRGLASGISSGAGAAIHFMGSLPGKLKSALGSLGGDLISAGSDLIRGLVSGIESMAGAAVHAAESVVGGAVSAAKSLLGISSPSKVFHKIGEQTIEGFIAGLEGGKAAVQAAITAITGVKPFKDSAITKTISSIEAEMKKAVKSGNLTPAQEMDFTALLGTDNTKLQKLAQQRQKIETQIKAADTLAASVQAAAIAGGDITQIAPNTIAGQQQADQAEGAPGTAQNPYQNIQQGLQAQLSGIKQFRAQIKQLKKDGLDKAGIQQLLAAGVQSGGATATQMLAEGKTGVEQITKLQNSIGKASKNLGVTGANAAYENASQIGKSLAAGLKDSLQGIDKTMDAIVKTLITTIMTALGDSGKEIKDAMKKLDKELGLTSGASGGSSGGGGKVTAPHKVYHPPAGPIMHPAMAAASSGGSKLTDTIVLHSTIITNLDGKEMSRTTRTQNYRHARRNPTTYPNIPGRS